MPVLSLINEDGSANRMISISPHMPREVILEGLEEIVNALNRTILGGGRLVVGSAVQLARSSPAEDQWSQTMAIPSRGSLQPTSISDIVEYAPFNYSSEFRVISSRRNRNAASATNAPPPPVNPLNVVPSVNSADEEIPF